MELSHMTVVIRGRKCSTEVFTEIFDAKEVYSSKENNTPYFQKHSY